MNRRVQLVIYVGSVVIVYALVVIPHVLEFGWAWGWPGAGLGFAVSLLGSALTIAAGVLALVLVLALPKQPRLSLLVRIAAVPLILIGPGLVFGLFGGLATSQGRGLASRVRNVTPVDSLQKWAVAELKGSGASLLPPEVARTLPSHAEIENREDHIVVRWYDRGLLVGAPDFRPQQQTFFRAKVRPGVYVYVEEH